MEAPTQKRKKQSLHLNSLSPLQCILLRRQIIIIPNLTRVVPEPLKLLICLVANSPDIFPKPFMPFSVLLNALLNLALVRPSYTVCFWRRALAGLLLVSLAVCFDGGEGCVGWEGVALFQTGFDFENGVE